jgi:hypothetical protein
MNTRVTIRAAGIDVTASNESQALTYLKEDGSQFRAAWEYELSDTSSTDEGPGDADDVLMEVETTEPAGKGERTWNGDVLFTVVVEGEVEGEEAVRAAREIVIG